jgi:hypothetical protein
MTLRKKFNRYGMSSSEPQHLCAFRLFQFRVKHQPSPGGGFIAQMEVFHQLLFLDTLK